MPLYVSLVDEPRDPPPLVLGISASVVTAKKLCQKSWDDNLPEGSDPLEWEEMPRHGEGSNRPIYWMADPMDGELVFIVQEVET
jgi:hypothetical protein